MRKGWSVPLLLWVLLPLWLLGDVLHDVKRTADSLAALCAEPLYNYNTEATRTLLKDALKKNRYIRAITLTDTLTGKRFIGVEQPGSESETTQSVRKDIRYNNERIGQLTIAYSSILWTLTPEEKQWIADHSVVKAGMFNWEPIAVLQKKELSGITGDYLSIISERTGIRFEIVPAVSWSDTLKKLEEKKIDLIPSIAGEGLSRLGNVSNVYMRFPYVVVSRMNTSFINALDDLRGKKVAVPKDWYVYAFLKKYYPKIHLVPTSGIIEALEKVKEGKAYAFVGHMAVAMYYVGNYYQNTLHLSGKISYTFEHRILVRKEEKTLIGIVNKALDSITPLEHLQIRNRWLHIEVKEATDYTRIYLVGALFLIVILISLYWNRKLSSEIQERKEIEKKLARAKQEAEQANSAKSVFLANMSHEIRTPMNAIVGFTELLEEEVKDPRLKSYVQNIQHASQTLLRLINDILDLSKIEAGKLELKYTPTDVASLCREVVSVFELTVQKQGVEFIIDLDEELPRTLELDEIRLRQILLNLIGNAVKFTETGHITVSARVFTSDDDPRYVDLRLVIEDTGIGIPPDQIDAIFGAFQQMEGQDNRKYGGTGLGLSISKRLCEMMGGGIRVESTPGEGSTFIVDLPHVAVGSGEQKRVTRHVHSLEAFSEATVLIVDDIEDNRELLVRVFEKSRLRTLTARDGEEAVELFKRSGADLVLMDIRMPRMDGYAAAEKIKAISPGTPIIALTASVMQTSVQADRFDGFLGKPIDWDALWEQLARFLPVDSASENRTEEESEAEQDAEILARLRAISPSDMSEVRAAYRQAVSRNSIPDIQIFATALRRLAEYNDIEALEQLSRDLETALSSFDIATIEALLAKFQTYYTRL